MRGCLLRMRNVALILGGLLCVGSACAQGGSGEPAVAMGGRGVQGTVTAVAGDKLTLKTENGQVFQVVTTPNTTVRRGREQMKLADVHAGDGVGAMGEIDGPNKTVHALYLFVVDAEQLKKARESLGKTTIAGKITAIDELKLTILRPDGVSQTIAVDEDTSFKRGGRGLGIGGFGGGGRQGGGGAQGGSASPGGGGFAGGESITLADIKVGDTVAGQGALKSGIFVPTQLYVGDPAASGQRRHREQTPGAAAASAGASGEPKQ